MDHFAGTNLAGGAGDGATDLGIFEVRRERERVREETVAEQNTEGISPARIHGRLRAAPFRLVHHVVVQERGDVNQFHDHGKIDMFGIDCAGRATGEERDKRAEPFAAPADRISDVAFNRRVECRGLFNDSLFDFVDLRLDQPGHPRQRARTARCGRRSAARSEACESFHAASIEARSE